MYNLSENSKKKYKCTNLGCLEIVDDSNEYIRYVKHPGGSSVTHLEGLLKRIDDERNVSQDHKDKVKNLVCDYSHVFSKSDTDIGCCKTLKHHIVTEEKFPVVVASRRIPIGLEEKVDNLVQDLLDKQIIRKSESPWNAPLVCIRKSNGDVRLTRKHCVSAPTNFISF